MSGKCDIQQLIQTPSVNKTTNKGKNMNSPNPSSSNLYSLNRTYSGLFGYGGTNGDILPFEISRNYNTQFLDDASAPYNHNATLGGGLIALLILYALVIFIGQICFLVMFPFELSWTITNCLHGFVTGIYLHWIKGSPNFYEPGNVLGGLTFWEQLSLSSASSLTPSANSCSQSRSKTIVNDVGRREPTHAKNVDTNSTDKKEVDIRAYDGSIEVNERYSNPKLVLLLTPTLLTYAACHLSKYDPILSSINGFIWLTCTIPKMPFMHGVRIMGINRTVGIDDEKKKR
mmetsp:Transcript_60009/g.70109  ORF Transcript_60009/g.70109 Transcript_60009/m.70109 type:complete len:287 (+) Transcript_60009:78-938(+)